MKCLESGMSCTICMMNRFSAFVSNEMYNAPKEP